jgi:hypothetical protein
MADVDEAIAATAVGLNEDAKAARKRSSKAKAEPQAGQLVDGSGEVLLDAGPSAVVEPAPGEVDEALGKLGDAVARKESDVDLSEEGHLTAIERMENLASDYEIATKALVPDVRDFLLDQIKARPKPWSATSQGEQRDVAAACEHAAVELVRKVVEAVAADSSRQPIRCLLVGYSDKADDIKVDLKVKALSEEEGVEAVVGLHRAKGKHVLVTVASVDDYRGDGREAETLPDQPDLSFEAGSEITDEDLAGEDLGPGEVPPEERPAKPHDAHPLAHDELVALPSGDRTGRVRVNLKSETIEAEVPPENEGGTGFVHELRAATPQELAAERDRTADFSA